MIAAATVDPAVCPLCGGPNGCAMAPSPGEPAGTPVSACSGDAQACWCADVHFEPSLLARIPAEARRRACVCRACAEDARAPAG